MANKIIYKRNEFEVAFGVGDVVRVSQTIEEEGKKTRTQVFEGTVIAIKNRDEGKSFTVRRIGANKIGVEMIFPLNSPLITKVEVVRRGLRGTRQAKLYYIREKSRKEIDKIYSRHIRREKAKEEKAGGQASKKK